MGSSNLKARSHPAKFIVCAYKGRQIPKFKVSLEQNEFRPRCGGNVDLRVRSYPASILFVLTKSGRSLNSLAMLIFFLNLVSLRVKGLRS